MLFGTLLILALLFQEPQTPEPSLLPASPQAFQKEIGVRKVQELTAPGLEIWCEDPKLLKKIRGPALAAWKLAGELLGPETRPGRFPIRVVLVRGKAPFERWFELLGKESLRLKGPTVDRPYVEASAEFGSAQWYLPPTSLIRTDRLSPPEAVTRVVEDLGALRLRYAFSPFGLEPPPFLAEGFAGLLVRHTLRNPESLQPYGGPAPEWVQGTSVYNLDKTQKDPNYLPANWPRLVLNTTTLRIKKKSIQPEETLAGLMLREAGKFARLDYAFSWAGVEFLLAKDRRAAVLGVLHELRGEEFAAASESVRFRAFHDGVLKALEQDPIRLQASFHDWIRKSMPRR